MKKKAEEILQGFLLKREAEGSLRSLQNKGHLVDFCSNDYLGMARSDELRDRIIKDLKEVSLPAGATGSRLISGNHAMHKEVEQMLVSYYRGESGLLFNSGYDANLGFFSSVPQYNDLILFDELCHASIRDGIKLSRARSLAFDHNDLQNLEAKLIAGNYEQIYIAVESIYSMDGDYAPLQELAALCKKYEANLVVDEAHATGLYGEKGEGRIVELGLQKDCFARLHTFGKSLGCQGAIIIGSEVLVQFLVNFARSFIYTTAMPIFSLLALKNAHDILSIEGNKLYVVSELLSLFKQKLDNRLMARLLPSDSPIQSLLVPGNDEVILLSAQLEAAGFYAKAIVYPTVPRGKERIRFCFHTFNTPDEIKGLVDTLNGSLR